MSTEALATGDSHKRDNNRKKEFIIFRPIMMYQETTFLQFVRIVIREIDIFKNPRRTKETFRKPEFQKEGKSESFLSDQLIAVDRL